MKHDLTRRAFVRTAAAGSAVLAWLGSRHGPTVYAAEASKPALLGGRRVHPGSWPKWPEWRESWEADVIKVLRSGRWSRAGGGGQVPQFEDAWARLLGAKRALGTSSGTTALITSLYVMGVDAGDEVICSPYTFSATYNAILLQKALPVLADTDPATLTMDVSSIESRITDRTRALLPVHIYGLPCEMDPIIAIARKHKLAVVEDACQAWLAEYQGRKCGTLGDLGCFSFQNSKHIPSGEGGAVTGMSDDLLDRCHSFHNCGRSVGKFKGSGVFTRGTNYRMQHFQASILMAQIDKLVKETEVRRANADYLNANLRQIPGITPVRLAVNSRPVWHLYPVRYDSKQFNGMSRARFIQAMVAEGVPCHVGYPEFYFDGLLDEAINSTGYKRLWGAGRLKAYRESFKELKGTKQVCETTVGFSQSMLLADRGSMDHIIEAARKVHAHSAALSNAA